MDVFRPVPPAESAHQPTASDRAAEEPSIAVEAAITGEWADEQSPPFRSNRVILDGGRAVGLTEPSPRSEQPCGPVWRDESDRRQWTPLLPAVLRSSGSGVGVWLGALTVVGLAAMVLGPILFDLADGPRNPDSVDGEQPVVPGLIGEDAEGHQASRARTTGEMTEQSSAGAAVSGRSVGPADGADLDLDLGHRSPDPQSPIARSGDDSIESPATAGEASDGAVDPAAQSDPGDPSTTSTIDPSSSVGGVTGSTTVPVTSGGDPAQNPPSSIPFGSTSVPEPGTLPPPVTAPPTPSAPPSVPSPPTTRPSTTPPRPPTTAERPVRPSVPSTRPSVPPTPSTRRPVPADTRPTPSDTRPGSDVGRGRDRAASVSGTPPNRGNGRAVGQHR